MARQLLGLVLVAILGFVLVGCEPAPIVRFDAPGINMHIEGQKILSVTPLPTPDLTQRPTVKKVDDKYYEVTGLGEVRIEMGLTDTHVVQIFKDHIRVHGLDVTDTEVFVEKQAVMPDKVHPGKVKK